MLYWGLPGTERVDRMLASHRAQDISDRIWECLRPYLPSPEAKVR